MVVLFLTFLKVKMVEIYHHIKNPVFLGYIVASYLFIIPVLIFIVFQYVDHTLGMAFLLLAAVPPGVAAAPFTDMLKGNTSLSFSIVLVSYLVAPLTVPFVFYLLTSTTLSIDLYGMFQMLALMILVPLFCAQIVKKTKPSVIEKTKHMYTAISIICISFITYAVIAPQSSDILTSPWRILTQLFWLYLLFFSLQIIGYFLAFWRKKEDKIAIGVSKTYMNNALAIVLAFSFLTPEIALIAVISEIPWSTTLGMFRWFIREKK